MCFAVIVWAGERVGWYGYRHTCVHQWLSCHLSCATVVKLTPRSAEKIIYLFPVKGQRVSIFGAAGHMGTAVTLE